MLGIREKYNTFKESTHFTKLKASGRFAVYAFCIYLATTFTIGCLGLIIGSFLLTLPLAMLISNPIVWILMGIVLTATYKMVIEPLFYLVKDYVDEKGTVKEEKSPKEQKFTRSKSLDSGLDTISRQTNDSDKRVRRNSYSPSTDSGIAPGSEPASSNNSRRNSNASGDSGVSVGSIESEQPKQTKIVRYSTAGDGNCFFHAVFGIDSSGIYKAERAQDMRMEWHKFLSQFKSLDDPSMPVPLRDQLKIVFGGFLEKPKSLIGRSEKIKELAERTNKEIEEAKSKTKELKEEIVKNFRDDGNFRKEIYPVIEGAITQRNERNIDSPGNQKTLLSIEDLLKEENKERLFNDIGEDFRSCALKLNRHLEREYDNTYDPKVIEDSFCDGKVLYKAYLEAIESRSYFPFAEEILILASLAEIEIHLYPHVSSNQGIFKPNSEMINDDQRNQMFERESYTRDDELWGSKEQKTIYLEGNHYERAGIVEREPSLMEKVSSAIQGAATVCVNALGLNT